MSVDSRVDTPHGPGQVINVYRDDEWEFGRLVLVVWLRVKLDDGRTFTFNADECEPAGE